MKLHALLLAALCLPPAAQAIEVNYVGPKACSHIAASLATTGEALANDELTPYQRARLEAYAKQLWQQLYSCERKHSEH